MSEQCHRFPYMAVFFISSLAAFLFSWKAYFIHLLFLVAREQHFLNLKSNLKKLLPLIMILTMALVVADPFSVKKKGKLSRESNTPVERTLSISVVLFAVALAGSVLADCLAADKSK